MESFEAALKLVPKYSGQYPRYTSYPTAQELKAAESAEDIAANLKNTGGEEGMSLYVHLPYCPSLCYFCACNKIIDPDPENYRTYLGLLAQEADLLCAAAGRRIRAAHVHLGGGSPSYMPLGLFAELSKILADRFDLIPQSTRSVELDPRSFDRSKAKELFNAGWTRASLGVQDFDPKVQEIINRIQSFELTRETVDGLRSSGFTAVNIDLIYGLPGQNPESLRNTIEKALTLNPDRIAFYGYAHVNWKVKVQGVFNKHPLPSPEERLELFRTGSNILTANGFEYIGLDHFAKPNDSLNKARSDGRLRRNFMGYTDEAFDGVLGLGVSAISDLSGIMHQNETSLDAYAKKLGRRQLPISKVLVRTPEDRVRAEIIERIMCHGFVRSSDISLNPAMAADIMLKAAPSLAPFAADSLLAVSSDSIEVFENGRLFLRQIASVFDAYLDGQTQKSGAKVFSQGI